MAPKTIIEAREPAATRKPDPTVVAAIAKLRRAAAGSAVAATDVDREGHLLAPIYELRNGAGRVAWAR